MHQSRAMVLYRWSESIKPLGIAETILHRFGRLDLFNPKRHDDLLLTNGALNFSPDMRGLVGVR